MCVVVDMDANATTHIGVARDGDGGTDKLLSIEDVIGSAFGDSVTGNAGGNVLDLRSGRDAGNGDAGNDTIFGGSGNDRLSGGRGDDLLVGGAGDDTYLGGAGEDSLVGSGSNAFISNGNATLGQDTFKILSASQGIDRVFAFDTSTTGKDASVDNIDLVSLFNSIGYAGTDPFGDGHLRVVNGGAGLGGTAADAVLQVDLDGGGDSWISILRIVDVSAATMMSNPDYFTFQ
jgi:Ca2+-binding RTX toxin-like protein